MLYRVRDPEPQPLGKQGGKEKLHTLHNTKQQRLIRCRSCQAVLPNINPFTVKAFLGLSLPFDGCCNHFVAGRTSFFPCQLSSVPSHPGCFIHKLWASPLVSLLSAFIQKTLAFILCKQHVRYRRMHRKSSCSYVEGLMSCSVILIWALRTIVQSPECRPFSSDHIGLGLDLDSGRWPVYTGSPMLGKPPAKPRLWTTATRFIR